MIRLADKSLAQKNKQMLVDIVWEMIAEEASEYLDICCFQMRRKMAVGLNEIFKDKLLDIAISNSPLRFKAIALLLYLNASSINKSVYPDDKTN